MATVHCKYSFNSKYITQIWMTYDCDYDYIDPEKLKEALKSLDHAVLNQTDSEINIHFCIYGCFVGDTRPHVLYSDDVDCYGFNDFQTAKQKCVDKYDELCATIGNIIFV